MVLEGGQTDIRNRIFSESLKFRKIVSCIPKWLHLGHLSIRPKPLEKIQILTQEILNDYLTLVKMTKASMKPSLISLRLGRLPFQMAVVSSFFFHTLCCMIDDLAYLPKQTVDIFCSQKVLRSQLWCFIVDKKSLHWWLLEEQRRDSPLQNHPLGRAWVCVSTFMEVMASPPKHP